MDKNQNIKEQNLNLKDCPNKTSLVVPNGVHLNRFTARKERKFDQYCKPPQFGISKRLELAWLVNFGLIICFGMRCNLSVAIVKMMSIKDNKNMLSYQWTPKTVSLVHSSFFWGYIITNILGGRLAIRYSPTKLFGAAIFMSSFLNMIIPVATVLSGVCGSGITVIVVRVTQGLIEGVLFPSVHGILIQWAPPQERSKLATLVYSGMYSGPLFAMPISGFMADHVGWYAPYYIYGCVGIIWYLLWSWLAFQKPSTHPYICIQ